MYDFVVQITLVASLAIIVYLLARSLPRVEDLVTAGPRHDRFDKLLKKLPLERVDVFIQSFFEKFLRKLKITVLKIDNLINEYLGKIKRHSEMRHQQSVIREKMEQMTEDKS